jgi:hypothetical protein
VFSSATFFPFPSFVEDGRMSPADVLLGGIYSHALNICWTPEQKKTRPLLSDVPEFAHLLSRKNEK